MNVSWGHSRPRLETPSSYDDAAELLRSAAADGRPVRFRGSGTKLGWGRPIPEPDLELCTEGLDRILEHNAGDFTAVLQAGVPLAVAEDTIAGAGRGAGATRVVIDDRR